MRGWFHSGMLSVGLVFVSLNIASSEELPLGKTVEVKTTDQKPAVFELKAEGPGMLSVFARAKSGMDIVLEIRGDDDAELDNNSIDLDYRGDQGAEQASWILPVAGNYTVVVRPHFGKKAADVVFGATWLPHPSLAGAAPLGRKSAVPIKTGEWIKGQIGAEKRIMLYAFEAKEGGTLTVSTRAAQGDIVLKAYKDRIRDDQIIATSDQDLDGNTAKEIVNFSMERGLTYYVAVHPFGNGVMNVNFEIQAVVTKD